MLLWRCYFERHNWGVLLVVCNMPCGSMKATTQTTLVWPLPRTSLMALIYPWRNSNEFVCLTESKWPWPVVGHTWPDIVHGTMCSPDLIYNILRTGYKSMLFEHRGSFCHLSSQNSKLAIFAINRIKTSRFATRSLKEYFPGPIKNCPHVLRHVVIHWQSKCSSRCFRC